MPDSNIKRIVILANSYKTGGRCIAGREIEVGETKHKIGPWIRPVSKHEQGELHQNHYIYISGDIPIVLDIIELPLESNADEPGQPENWNLGRGSQWKKLGTFPQNQLSKLEQSPANIWLDTNERRSDRISARRQADGDSSLYLIRPTDFKVRMFWSVYDGNPKRKTYAQFSYNGAHYSFSLTDLAFLTKYCVNPPSEGNWKEVKERWPQNLGQWVKVG